MSVKPTVPPKPKSGVQKGHKRVAFSQRIRITQRVAAERAMPNTRPWHEIAKAEDVPLTTLRDWVREFEQTRAQLDDDGGIVEESMHLFNKIIDQLSELGEFGTNEGARVGALRTLADMVKMRLGLLSAMGRLPQTPARLGEREEALQIARGVAGILEKHDITDEALEEIAALLGGEEEEAEVVESLAIEEKSGK